MVSVMGTRILFLFAVDGGDDVARDGLGRDRLDSGLFRPHFMEIAGVRQFGGGMLYQQTLALSTLFMIGK